MSLCRVANEKNLINPNIRLYILLVTKQFKLREPFTF